MRLGAAGAGRLLGEAATPQPAGAEAAGAEAAACEAEAALVEAALTEAAGAEAGRSRPVLAEALTESLAKSLPEAAALCRGRSEILAQRLPETWCEPAAGTLTLSLSLPRCLTLRLTLPPRPLAEAPVRKPLARSAKRAVEILLIRHVEIPPRFPNTLRNSHVKTKPTGREIRSIRGFGRFRRRTAPPHARPAHCAGVARPAIGFVATKRAPRTAGGPILCRGAPPAQTISKLSVGRTASRSSPTITGSWSEVRNGSALYRSVPPGSSA